MGYYASGCGDINLKSNVDLKIIQKIIDDHDCDIEIVQLEEDRNGNPYIYVSDSTSHWDEEDIWGLLEDVEPYTEDGVLNYSGDEDCIWRYVFDKDEGWKEENASIDYDFESYSDEELIAELVKRGYKVTK